MSNRPILLVDDEAQNLAVLENILSDKYPLVFVTKGKEVLMAVHKHKPSLILLDIQMPDMDGYTVCRQLKADPQTENIPVIFISGLVDICDEVAGFLAGGVDYITKPVSPSIVLARVKTHLSLVRAIDLEQSYYDAIYMLGAAGHYNDCDTGVHIWRMAAYASALAKACDWCDEDWKKEFCC